MSIVCRRPLVFATLLEENLSFSSALTRVYSKWYIVKLVRYLLKCRWSQPADVRLHNAVHSHLMVLTWSEKTKPCNWRTSLLVKNVRLVYSVRKQALFISPPISLRYWSCTVGITLCVPKHIWSSRRNRISDHQQWKIAYRWAFPECKYNEMLLHNHAFKKQRQKNGHLII